MHHLTRPGRAAHRQRASSPHRAHDVVALALVPEWVVRPHHGPPKTGRKRAIIHRIACQIADPEVERSC